MRPVLIVVALIGAAGLPGCVVVQTGVTNPMPGMTTVAVAPFINLSAERSVDGRRFALAYHAELQKIPGYQVIPVGVAEQAIVDLGLDLSGPDDALRLAEALGADAVVIGAVTDYTPYYPPRIGLQISWYAPEAWRFTPGIPTDPQLGDAVRGWRFVGRRKAPPFQLAGRLPDAAPIVRSQTPDEAAPKGVVQANAVAGPNPIRLIGIDTAESGPGPILFPPPIAEERPTTGAPSTPEAVQPVSAELPALPPQDVSFEPPSCPPSVPGPDVTFLASGVPCPPHAGLLAPPAEPRDPRRPVMAYTRLFDGSDADLTAILRDYVVLSGDLRSGGWEAYLHRTDDFIRFTAHRMIVEMLTLHGGESKRRYVWMLPREKM